MRISDWSSDVCSSDLEHNVQLVDQRHVLDCAGRRRIERQHALRPAHETEHLAAVHMLDRPPGGQDTQHELQPQQDQHRRSEEHTSELQSLMRISYAVFCLKKTKNKNTHTTETKHL